MLKRKFVALLRFVPKLLAVVAGITLIFDIACLILGNMGYWVNVTNSMPVGVYREESGDIKKDNYVLLCKDDYELNRAKNDDYLCKDGHMPLLKRVVAVKNDVVTVSNEGVYVNYTKLENSERIVNSWLNEKNLLDYTLKDKEFLVMGRSPYSWDSRYFGIVRRDEFISKVVPVFLVFSKYEDLHFNY